MQRSCLPQRRPEVCFVNGECICCHEPCRSDFNSFLDYSTIFNGNVITIAKAVVCPLDAEDVSRWVSDHCQN